MSWPATVTEPAVGGDRPHRWRSSVVLPQPDGPITTNTSPRRMPMSTPSSTVRSPYSVVNPTARTRSSEWRRPEGTAVSYTHLRAHETPEHLVCRLLLE